MRTDRRSIRNGRADLAKGAQIYALIGTKAQLVKMAPLMAEMSRRGMAHVFIWTGQHHDTIDDLLANFGLPGPDVTLTKKGRDVIGVMQMTRWLAGSVWRLLLRGRSIFHHPGGIVLVHGDTMSALLGAVMGKLNAQRVAHIESGLRSYNILHPFPEELTRVLVSQLTDYHFCPNRAAVKNLRSVQGTKFCCGANTLYDALTVALKQVGSMPIGTADRYAVASVHRFENICTKNRLLRVIAIIERAAEDTKVSFILHKPTEARLREFGLYERLAANPHIELRPRCDYFSFIRLCRSSEFLLTDGGSNQEESFYMGHPCLLLRMATERNEGLGYNVVLSRFDCSVIDDFLAGYEKYRRDGPAVRCSPSAFIVDSLSRLLDQRGTR